MKMISMVESLKLQRNTENYNYLRTVQSSQIRGWPSDKEDFYSTKVVTLFPFADRNFEISIVLLFLPCRKR